jgi:hypothetical protein
MQIIMNNQAGSEIRLRATITSLREKIYGPGVDMNGLKYSIREEKRCRTFVAKSNRTAMKDCDPGI